ncbi:MAG: proton-conducting transporter membrane subunit [Bauldia sp.]
MTGETLIALALVIPAATALLTPLFARHPNLRESVTLLGTVLLFAALLALLSKVLGGARPALHVLDVVPGLAVAFAVEPLGMLFATVASGLWIVTSLYSIGYMRANHEVRQTGYYVAFAAAIVATVGIALAGNLFTLFLFYEMLTLVTYPLVIHHRTPEAKAAGRLYLMMLLGASTVLLLPAIAWTAVAAGTLDFRPGGILAEKLSPTALAMLLALFAFGIAKAALVPLHFWLPAAMVAPTPVSALLHAVAVVKAGVFFVVKVIVYVFGVETLSTSGAGDWLVFAAAGSILIASMVAMTRDNLKARLAYSTVSQLGYVVLGAALATHWGIVGSGMQIATHALGKITLFFCAGAIYTVHHKTEVSELAGLGRVMPVTFAAFLVGALSIIGLPPGGGLWSKWYLVLGALDGGQIAIVAVLMISSLLNVAYLLPIPLRAFFGTAEGEATNGRAAEAPLPLLLAMSATSLACVILFFFPGIVFNPLQSMATQ